MIRVGFVLSFQDQSWIGGLNYYKSLLFSIQELPDRQIEPVLFVSTQTPDALLKDFPPIEQVKLAMLSRWSVAWVVRKFVQRLAGKDILLERQLKKLGIAVLSHSSQPLGKNAAVITMGWIPDFQHRRLPEFFDDEERIARNNSFREICNKCDVVLLSSYSAQADLQQFMPECLPKSRVLQFVSNVKNTGNPAAIHDIREKYQIEGPYFHLPNQFWRHKNHGVVVEALRLLKQQGKRVTVVCTGNTEDHRHPEYFVNLMREVEKHELTDEFRVLGVVPYPDLMAIMRNSVALINPSLFEGWSTTVEESKMLGKTTILSNIDVHMEQAPPKGIYFDPHHAEVLASLLEQIASSNATDEPPRELSLQYGRREFAERYQRIVLEAAGNVKINAAYVK